MGAKKRIEWIDAMRGFTMLLVVYTHIQVFGLGINVDGGFTFNQIFQLFRMPLFFFISGFILYKADAAWDRATAWAFLRKKFVVQIIPTMFFILVFAACFQKELKTIFLSQDKDGYWFTFMLFVYFAIYVSLQGMMRLFKMRRYETVALLIAGITINLLSTRVERFLNPGFFHLFSIYNWNFFLYFVFGCLVKKHFGAFQKLLDSRYFVPFIQLTFLTACIYFVQYLHICEIPGLYVYVALTGIIIVVAFFRKYEASFTQGRRLGRCLQYVGRRTLDVYLLHYFFLPRGLNVNKYELGRVIAGNPVLEFAVSISLSILVIGICLIVSNVLRTSPILGHYLFGVQLPEDKQ